jgi:hypothetical protein
MKKKRQDVRQRKDNRPRTRRNLPLWRHERRAEHDYPDESYKTEEESDPEPSKDPGYFDKEIRALDLLLRRSPSDIEREHVCEESGGDVYAEPTKKEKAVFGQ